MTSSANASSGASSEARTLAAEEIARLLREEEQAREPSEPPAEQPRPRRVAPGELPPPRPVQPSQEAPPLRRAPRNRRLPPPRVPPSGRTKRDQTPPARESRFRPVWTVFILIAALASIVGQFADDGGSEGRDPVNVSVTSAPAGPRFTIITARSDLSPGMCLPVLLPLPGGSAPIPIVPCDELHGYEVLAIVDSVGPTIAVGGDEQAKTMDEQECQAEFLPYVGERDATSPFDLIVVSPTESEWVEDGERLAICLLYLREGSQRRFWEGSARDSGGQ